MTYEELAEKVAEFFTEESGEETPEESVMELEPVLAEGDLMPSVENTDGEEVGEKEEEGVLSELSFCEEPPPIVLSLSERVDALAAAMENGLLDPGLHADPENFTISALYDRARQGAYVGQLYTNTDTGADYKIVIDGKEYWL